MNIYKGINALTKSQAESLLSLAKLGDKNAENLSAEFVHFVQTSAKLTAEEEKKLAELLSYGKPYEDSRDYELFLVVPRPGTISPWSSKATDIARNCGLGKIVRIERGTAHYIKGKKPLDRPKVAVHLHDRMTESVLRDFDQAEALFARAAPKPFVEVDVLAKGKTALTDLKSLGRTLDNDEIDYLVTAYKDLGRNPTDVELMMFSQVNSERTLPPPRLQCRLESRRQKATKKLVRHDPQHLRKGRARRFVGVFGQRGGAAWRQS